MKREFEIINDLAEITNLSVFIEELCEELALPFETIMHINLALEEAVANIIMYAYPATEKQSISLQVNASDKQIIFLLTDKGVSFDPTQKNDELPLDLPIEDRPIGGLGIFLIRSIMNEVSYQRLDGENRLTLKKDL